MKVQKVEVADITWDRCARKGIIKIGSNKVVLDITFAPAISQPNEMLMFVRNTAIEPLNHVHACVIKLHDASDTIKPVVLRSKNAAIDSDSGYKVKNLYANAFLDFMTIIIDPATDSMKYECHMKEFATSTDVPFELRKFANKMESLRVRKKRGSVDPEGTPYETRIKREYEEYWDWLMASQNSTKLTTIVREAIEAEFGLGADIGMAPVPVMDSEKMLEYTKQVNRFALAIWPKDQRDNCATYIILAPEVFSNPTLMDKIIDYIYEVETKFIVFKFKNLELDQRSKGEETLELKKLLDAVIQIKHEHKDDKIFVALEAGVQMYPLAVGGFDIISTSMTGMDGDFPFRRVSKTALNGYFDLSWLTFRSDKFVRTMLENGGLMHDGCICATVKDYASAKVDWYTIRREHYIRRVDELYTEIWSFIDERKIELGKRRLSNSRISNLKQALPLLDYT